MSDKNNKVNISNFFKIVSYVKNYKFVFSIAVICMVISSLSMTVSTILIKNVIDDYIVPMTTDNNSELFNGFKLIILKLSLIFLFAVVAKYMYSIIMAIIESKLLEDIRNKLFNKMIKLPISFFDGSTKGDIMSLYTNDIDTIRFTLSMSLSAIICCSINIIGIISAMFYYNFKLTMLVFCIFCLMVLIARFISIVSRKLFEKQQNKIGAINGFIEEAVNGQNVIKVFCHEKQTLNDFNTYNEDLYNVSCKGNTYSNMLMPLLVNSGNIGYTLVLIFGSFFVMSGNMSLGVILALLKYTKAFVNPISELSEQIPVILKAIAGVERISNILKMDDEIDDGQITIFDKKIHTNEKDIDFNGNLKFENVCFKYKKGSGNLKNINFDIERGQKIAFVGSTGAGKTTVTNLVMRFYDVDSGKITIDGVNINDIKKKDLRNLISIVLQDVHMFNGSIIDNIRYGKSDAKDEEIIKIAQMAKIDSFVKHLKNGYDTNLKSDADNLSQGEKQLLAIARAIVADRPILIFDEATSSVDTRTEKIINDVLENLFKDKTVFVIAHRLSTIKNADKIVVLENGEIIEYGNHEELLKNKGRYYQLCNGLVEFE